MDFPRFFSRFLFSFWALVLVRAWGYDSAFLIGAFSGSRDSYGL